MDTVLLPIERARLEGALAPFGASTGLPGEAYTSPATFAWEMRHFFEDSWVCVGRSADLPQAGDRRAVKAGAESAPPPPGRGGPRPPSSTPRPPRGAGRRG